MPTSYQKLPNEQPVRNATLQIHQIDVVADGAGAVAPVDLPDLHGWVALLEVIPGPDNKPSALFDTYLKTADGIDVLGGQGEQLDNVNPSQFIPQVGEGLGTRPVHGTLTFSGSDIGAGETYTIKMTLEK